ncbi:MAG: phosphodiester glycosidase family protein [Rhizobiaceae bacterium]|nr:phosphodiester glycosidase family protein [Rhizobiaceae bacterium]
MKNLYSKLPVSLSMALLLSAMPIATAQELPAPSRTLQVANYLRDMAFATIVPGLSGLRTVAKNGVEIIALRISPQNFKFGLATQSVEEGERVEVMGARESAQVAFNGGFFSIAASGRKFPVGLLINKDIRSSSRWKKAGGYLVFQDGNISIVPTRQNKVPEGETILQSKPTLIEPGGKWAMNTNSGGSKNRTLVCNTAKGDVIVMVVIGGGMSLFEAGWLMRSSEVGGVFDCDSALAMDGGSSTQIWVKDRPDLSFTGNAAVHNSVFIVQQQSGQ